MHPSIARNRLAATIERMDLFGVGIGSARLSLAQQL